jgi:molybdate transport system regulatory protein
MAHIDTRIRIHFNGELAIGPGRIELLEGVQRTGSLAQAARSMNMSYRRAWLLMQSLNESLASPASVAAKGGRHGGGATLTPLGLQLIRAYRRFEARAQREARQRFSRFAAPSPAGPAIHLARRSRPA